MLSAEGMSPNFPRSGSDVDYGFYDFMFQIDFPADFVRKPTAVRYPKRISVIVYVEGWSEATNEYMRFINHPYGMVFTSLFVLIHRHLCVDVFQQIFEPVLRTSNCH